MIFIEAALFVLSSGLLFNERFRSNLLLVTIAGVLAIVSSYLLMQQLFGSDPNFNSGPPTASISSPPSRPEPFTTYRPADIPGAREAIAAGVPYTVGCMDLDNGERACIQYPMQLPAPPAP